MLSRDAANVVLTYDFIVLVDTLTKENEGRTLKTLARLANLDYRKKRAGYVITEIDVHRAQSLLQSKMPVDPAGQVFYCAYLGETVEREAFEGMGLRSYRLYRHLGRKLKLQIEQYRKEMLQVVSNIRAIEATERHFGTDPVIAYWQAPKVTNQQQQVIANARKLLIDGKQLRAHLDTVWLNEYGNRHINLELQHINVEGQHHAVKPYIRLRHGRIGLCTRKSYITV